MASPAGPVPPEENGRPVGGGGESVPQPRIVDVREQFTNRMWEAVGGEIWPKLRVADYGHNTAMINIGPVSHLCFDDITIAVTPTEGGYRVELLSVNDQSVERGVEWRAFIIFMRHLYVKECDAVLMCETDMMDVLQSVLDWYRVGGVALEFYDGDTDKRTVVLRGERGGPLFVEINRKGRVRECRDFERPIWKVMCKNVGEARAKGCMAVDDEYGREPGSIPYHDSTKEPDSMLAQLRKLDAKLPRFC
jgi:hypothetical protein